MYDLNQLKIYIPNELAYIFKDMSPKGRKVGQPGAVMW